MDIDKYLDNWAGCDMTINPENSMVVYFPINGHSRDHKLITECGVKPGDILTVETILIGSWSSEVSFKEIPGWHNTVCFEDVQFFIPQEAKE